MQSSADEASPVNEWAFDVVPETAVVTTTHVMRDRQPVLSVSHVYDPDEGDVWQFHAGDDDRDISKILLVRLDKILKLDPTLKEIATLPAGSSARRASVGEGWVVTTDE